MQTRLCGPSPQPFCQLAPTYNWTVVNRYPALWSPDLPRRPRAPRLPSLPCHDIVRPNPLEALGVDKQ